MCETQFCYQKWVETCQVCKKAVCANHLQHSTHDADFPFAAPKRVSAMSASVTSVIQHTYYTIELIVFYIMVSSFTQSCYCRFFITSYVSEPIVLQTIFLTIIIIIIIQR